MGIFELPDLLVFCRCLNGWVVFGVLLLSASLVDPYFDALLVGECLLGSLLVPW